MCNRTDVSDKQRQICKLPLPAAEKDVRASDVCKLIARGSASVTKMTMSPLTPTFVVGVAVIAVAFWFQAVTKSVPASLVFPDAPADMLAVCFVN